MPDEEMSLDDAITTSMDGDHAEDSGDYTSFDYGDTDSYEEQPVESPDEIEARNAGMRQADYTRKTQELAAQRQELELQRQSLVHAEAIWNALNEDPAAVIEALHERFGDLLEEEDSIPPELQRLEEVEQYIEDQMNQQLLDQLYNECRSLQNEFSDGFDPDVLIEFAVDHEIPNLRAAYLLRRNQSERAARDKQRVAKKAGAPPILGGASRTPGSLTNAPDDISSFEDAFNAAMADIGNG